MPKNVIVEEEAELNQTIYTTVSESGQPVDTNLDKGGKFEHDSAKGGKFERDSAKRGKTEHTLAKSGANCTILATIDTIQIEAKETISIKCTVCTKLFSNESNMKRHRLTHDVSMKNGIKHRKYKCDLCKSDFYDPRLLQEHTKNYHTNKVFKCDVCHKRLGKLASLKYHLNAIHNIKT